MRWRRNGSARPSRPKVRRLSADEQKKLLAQLAREISSVLVNGHLFVGSPADTGATYRVRG
jgi:adenylate kinase